MFYRSTASQRCSRSSGLRMLGASHNYWIELAAITAVLASVRIWSYVGHHGPALNTAGALASILLISANVTVVLPLVVGVTGPGSLHALSQSLRDAEQFRIAIERVRSEPRDVLASPADLTALAGRPTLYEPHVYNLLYSLGRWDPAPLVGQICAGGVGLLVTSHPLQSDHVDDAPPPGWPAPIVAALRETMVLEREQAGRYFYTAPQSTPGTHCEALASWSAQTSALR